jgi:hypothetical protein
MRRGFLLSFCFYWRYFHFYSFHMFTVSLGLCVCVRCGACCSATSLVRIAGVRSRHVAREETPSKGKYDNVPTPELDLDVPGQFIILKRRYKDLVSSTMLNYKVSAQKV